MGKVKIGDISCSNIIRNKNNLALPVYSVTNSKGLCKADDYFIKTVHSNDLLKYKILKKGSIAYNPVNIKIGSICVNDKEDCLVSPLYEIIKLDESKILNDYFVYYIRSPKGNMQILKAAQGAVRITVKYSNLAKIEINLPSINIQKEIIENIKKIERDIENLYTLYNYYDDLVKSQFIEMFGDVIRNDKKFEECSFKDFVNQMNIGPFGSDLKNNCFVSKKEGYCVVYEQKNAIEKNTNGDFKYISKDKYEKMKRFDVGPGDIIVSCRGTIGKCFVLPNNAPHGIIHSSLMMIKPKKEVNNKFLVFLLENILSEQNELGSGVKMAIKANELAKIKTIRPSKKLQDEFIDIVEQIDKSKYFGGAEYGIC